MSGQNFSAGLRPAVCFGAQKAVLGGQSGVQAVLRALRRFSSDFRAFLVVFPRFSPDIGCRRAGSLVRGHRGRLPAAEMLETCWMLIAIRNVASTCSTFWEILSSTRRPPTGRGRGAHRRTPRRAPGAGSGTPSSAAQPRLPPPQREHGAAAERHRCQAVTHTPRAS